MKAIETQLRETNKEIADIKRQLNGIPNYELLDGRLFWGVCDDVKYLRRELALAEARRKDLIRQSKEVWVRDEESN